MILSSNYASHENQGSDIQTGYDLLQKIKAEKKKQKNYNALPPIKPEEIPFDILQNWLWCRFIEIADIDSNFVSPFDLSNHPHIAPDNIEKNTGRLLSYKTVVEYAVHSANHYFYPRYLIYSNVRPKINKIAKVNFEGSSSADMYPLKASINSDFLLFCMLSAYFLIQVDKFDNRVLMPKN